MPTPSFSVQAARNYLMDRGYRLPTGGNAGYLGGGGHGHVFLTIDDSGGPRVVKISFIGCSSHTQTNELDVERRGELAKRISYEANIHRYLTDRMAAGIVRCFQYWSDEQVDGNTVSYHAGVEMEFCPVGLEEILQRRALTPEEVRTLGVSLYRTLSEMHRYGICHGDLRSVNVVYDLEAKPRLIDFGSAHAYTREAQLALGIEPGELQTIPAHPRTAELYAVALLLRQALNGNAVIMPVTYGQTIRQEQVPARDAPRLLAEFVRQAAGPREQRITDPLVLAELLENMEF